MSAGRSPCRITPPKPGEHKVPQVGSGPHVPKQAPLAVGCVLLSIVVFELQDLTHVSRQYYYYIITIVTTITTITTMTTITIIAIVSRTLQPA